MSKGSRAPMFSDPSSSVEIPDSAWWVEGQKSQPFRVPTTILEEFPELPERLRFEPPEPKPRKPVAQAPVLRGYPDEERYAAEFARIAGDEGKAIIAELIDQHWLWWSSHLYPTLLAREPDIVEELEHSWQRGNLTKSSVIYNAVGEAGSKAQILFWGGWEPPMDVSCVLCARQYNVGDSYAHLLKRGFGYRFCPHCATAVYPGMSGDALTHAESLDDDSLAIRLRKLTGALGTLPTTNLWKSPDFHAFSHDQLLRVAAALMITPPPALFYRRFGKSWTRVLIKTGIIDGGRPTARGTMSLAKDGHLCRSLGELAIDNFFTDMGIQHEVEPAWPKHPKFNPSGRKRGDWLLSDGTFVEYAGLAGDSNYDEKIIEKVSLAQAVGINLEIVLPHELRNLKQRFRRYLPER